jgi:hypothetical protein
MPKRIPLGSIGVTRDGKTVYPQIGTETTGEAFDFTAEELVEITGLEKASGNRLVRKLIVEGDEGSNTEPKAPKALSAMNLEELTAEAAARNVVLGEAKTKAEIRAVIEAAAEAEEL